MHKYNNYYYNGIHTLFYWSNFVFINYYETYINKQVPHLAESYKNHCNRNSADSGLVVFAVPLYCGCAWMTPQVILISGWFIATICLFMNEVTLMTYWSVLRWPSVFLWMKLFEWSIDPFNCDEFSN